MLKPRAMSRVVIAGSKEHLRPTVEALHALGSLHIADYDDSYEGFKIGAPMSGAVEGSERLLKLRAASRTLGLVEGPPEQRRTKAWARARLETLLERIDREVKKLEAERQELGSSLRELERRRAAVLPFGDIPLPFEAYRPYESLVVFTGTADQGLDRELERAAFRHELFRGSSGGVFALFVERSAADEAERLLARHNFSGLKPPDETGLPGDALARIEREMERVRTREAAVNDSLAGVRESCREELLACSEELAIEIERAEAPLRFATTETAFLIEGWVPTDELERTEAALRTAARGRVHIERLEEREWLEEAGEVGAGSAGGGSAAERVRAPAAASGEDEERDAYSGVPVALSNPRPVKPFETLTELFSLPSYKEIDPSALLALVFPFFFGLMVGDLGYGSLLIATGVLFRTRLRKWDGFPELGAFVLAAGVFASLFGAFVFGEAFGLPFHSPAHGEGAEGVSWQTLTGVDVPLRASVHKLEASGLSTLMVFSVLAGTVHLCLGNALGAVNEWRHSRRRAAGRLGWMLIVLGFGLVILKFAERNSLGAWLWAGPLAPLSPSWDSGVGVLLPYASLALLVAGAAGAVAGEGPLALMELMGALSNILSYTRLAAIGVAKGAMAFAFNSILLPLVTGGELGAALAGWALLILAHMIVFVLGSFSSGIQALRLNYVEFFTKFFKGGGVKFRPFGYRRRYTTES